MNRSIYQIIEDIEPLLCEVEELVIKIRNNLGGNMMFTDREFQTIIGCTAANTYWFRRKKLISYSKLDGKIYYRMSDILTFTINDHLPKKK